jgi:hypothetical protein
MVIKVFGSSPESANDEPAEIKTLSTVRSLFMGEDARVGMAENLNRKARNERKAKPRITPA